MSQRQEISRFYLYLQIDRALHNFLQIESVQLIIKGLHSFREINSQENLESTNILNFDLALNVQANLGYIDVDVSGKGR